MSFANYIDPTTKQLFASNDSVGDGAFTYVLQTARVESLRSMDDIAEIVLKAELNGQDAAGIDRMGYVGTAELRSLTDAVADLCGANITFLGDVAISGDHQVQDLDVLGNLTVFGSTNCEGGANVSGGNLYIDDTADIVFSTSGVRVGSGAGGAQAQVGQVAVGLSAGQSSQPFSISIGATAGQTDQSGYAISIGTEAGQTRQQLQAVAIGYGAGQIDQSLNAIAVGRTAGGLTQGFSGVAIGTLAGNNTQGDYGIAIGQQAGQDNQGANAIAIGELAGQTSQPANSIAICATGSALNPTGASQLHIDPIRGVALGLGVGVLYYDSATKEIQYSTT